MKLSRKNCFVNGFSKSVEHVVWGWKLSLGAWDNCTSECCCLGLGSSLLYLGSSPLRGLLALQQLRCNIFRTFHHPSHQGNTYFPEDSSNVGIQMLISFFVSLSSVSKETFPIVKITVSITSFSLSKASSFSKGIIFRAVYPGPGAGFKLPF